MNSEIPQLDYSFFSTQIFWLAVTYLIFYLVLNKFIITKIRDVRKSRKDIDDSVNQYIKELKEKERVIIEKYMQELDNANKQVYKLVKNVKDNINKTIENSYSEFSKNLDFQMYNLKKRLFQIKEEKKLEYKEEIYDLSLKIFNIVKGEKFNKNIKKQ